MTEEYIKKFFNIIELLRKGTRENRIRWHEIPPGSKTIVVVLKNFRVLLSVETVQSGENIHYNLQIHNSLDHPLGGFSVSMYNQSEFMCNQSLFDILSSLYIDALEQALNIDGAIKEIEHELSSEGPIGREPEQE